MMNNDELFAVRCVRCLLCSLGAALISIVPIHACARYLAPTKCPCQ